MGRHEEAGPLVDTSSLALWTIIRMFLCGPLSLLPLLPGLGLSLGIEKKCLRSLALVSSFSQDHTAWGRHGRKLTPSDGSGVAQSPEQRASGRKSGIRQGWTPSTTLPV